MAMTDAERIAQLEAENTRLKNGEKPQLSRDDLKKMTPIQVNDARKNGQLRDILSIEDRRVPPNNRDWKPTK